MQKAVSLTDMEKEFLSSLLIDKKKKSGNKESKKCRKLKQKVLTVDMLCENPFKSQPREQQIQHSELERPEKQKERVDSGNRYINAHEVVVVPSRLKRLFVLLGTDLPRKRRERDMTRTSISKGSSAEYSKSASKEKSDKRSEMSIKSSKNDATSASSWDYDEGGFEHFDTWDVLRDEYARDFGFDCSYSDDDNDSESQDTDPHFAILGTSQDDESSSPHILSPPIMSSLFNFIPQKLSSENYWLKYSLLRDGAHLETLLRYVKAATNTIVAIQTVDGETVSFLNKDVLNFIP